MADETTKTTMTLEEFEAKLAENVEKTIRDMGLDSVDRKHGIFPSKDDPNGEKLEDLSKEQRVAKFLQAVVSDDKVTAKALSEGTPADGGYLVPTEFRATVISKLYKESVIRPRATVIPMRRDKMDVPAEGNAVTVSWEAENAEFNESNPTFGTKQLNTNKLTGLSKMSRELFADSAIPLLDYVSGVWARAFAQEEDKVFMTGADTTQPKGLRTESITSVDQAGLNLTADDLIALYYALPVQYRNRATWIMPNDVIAGIRGLKYAADGRYVWTEGLANATPTILGRPVIEQNDIPTNLGTGTNETEIFFGDLSFYLIGDREEMGVESTTVGAGAFEHHQVAFKAWERIDGRLGLLDAFRVLEKVTFDAEEA